MDSREFHHLGPKTLLIFILQSSLPALAVLVALIGVITVGPVALQSFTTSGVRPETLLAARSLIELVSLAGLGLFLLTFSIAILYAWLRYVTYQYAIGDHSFQVERGILSREEISIPYRQIQNVDIYQSLFERLLGVSRVIILTAGHEDLTGEERGESEGVLPIIDKRMADSIRNDLLSRTKIQEVRHT